MVNSDNLVKFCKPEHNILDRCHTIRFGTLEYYRDMDPFFAIADKEEGQEAIGMVDIDTSNASREVLETIHPTIQGNNIHLMDCTLISTYPNCYIWCCSRVTEPISAIQGERFDSDYTSFYGITDRHRFNECLMGLLMNSLTMNSFADAVKKILISDLTVREMKDIFIEYFHGEVVYVNKKESIIFRNQVTPYATGIPEKFRPLFVKSEKYKEDREYRFAFLFQHKRYGQLAVQKDPVDVPILPIAAINSTQKTQDI